MYYDRYVDEQAADNRSAIWVLVTLFLTIILIFGFFYYGVPTIRRHNPGFNQTTQLEVNAQGQ